MSVTTTLINGKYSVNFEAGMQVADTTKPNLIPDVVIYGQGGVPTIGAQLNNGTGAGNAQQIYNTTLTLAAAGTTTLTLSSGLSEAGQSIGFAIIRRMLIRLRTPASGALVRVGGAATHPWAPWQSDQTQTWDVDDFWLKISDLNGIAVGSGSHDQLKFLNPGASPIIFDVTLMGE